MPHYKYLIVGGGMTADAAVQGIREVDQDGSIGMISAEGNPPYNRPPLSKGLWKGKPFEKIWRGTEKQEGVELHLGRTAQSLDPGGKTVADDQGISYTYEKLLLATGGTPRRLPFGHPQIDAYHTIYYYRTVEDYQRLRAETEHGQRFGVIGSGFIGSEIAAALAMNGKQVVMVFPSETLCPRVFPRDLGYFVNDYYRDKGVELHAGDRVIGLGQRDGHIAIKTERSQELQVDGLVVGIGIEPNIDLARAAGLEVADGIVVDEALRTSQPDIYSAGDAANFYNPVLDVRWRVEHEDNANTMGKVAGQSVAGADVRYHHLPFFYSDLFDLGYEAVGDLDPRLETYADWKEPYREGVVYYLQVGRVRGVLLWNVWDQVPNARKLIAEPGPFQVGDLKGRLPG